MKQNKDVQTLTRVEMEIMTRLWTMEKKAASVRELLALYPDPKPAYTTIGTYMKILTQKGFVTPEKHADDGKTYFFRPLISQEEYRRRVMKDVKDTFFGGSIKSLVSFFMQEEKLKEEDIRELMELIAPPNLPQGEESLTCNS